MMAAVISVFLLPDFSGVWSDRPAAAESGGRVVLLTASWCGPCQRIKGQLPGLEAIGWTVGTGPDRQIQLVDIDAEPGLWTRWKSPASGSIPQAVFVTASGRPVRWLVAPRSAAAVSWFYYGDGLKARSVPDFKGVYSD